MHRAMAGLVLLIDADPATREGLTAAIEAHAFSVIAAASGGEALQRLAARGARPDAIVLDPNAPGLERTRFVDHLSGNVLVARVPVILLAEPGASSALGAQASAIVPRSAPATAILELLGRLRGGEPPVPPAQLATGTGSLPATNGDLHAYAASKITQYFGAARAGAIFASVLDEVGIARIETTAQLHRVAQALGRRGGLEAAVAMLLSGRATLIDSDRTLRR